MKIFGIAAAVLVANGDFIALYGDRYFACRLPGIEFIFNTVSRIPTRNGIWIWNCVVDTYYY